MPGYSVDVVDIGLTVEDALEMDLSPEPFSRKKSIPWELRWRLSDIETEYFGRRRERFELNAILPASRRIEYIERKLQENGVRGKVIPPDSELKRLAEEMYRDNHAKWVDEAIATLIDTDEIKNALADSFIEKFELADVKDHIEKAFEKDSAVPWRGALEDRLEHLQEDLEDDLKEAVREQISEAMNGGAA